ncbi:MAG TPA: DUF3352 domain-containing protein [Dehalococcoidia bacterium]|nr:DUF3352 domain-containing protein [Dehalococcoidia bacterium]
MSSRSRRAAIVVTLVLALAGGAVAGLILVRSGNATGIDLTSASLVPADAAAYVGLNSDLTSSQWVAAFDLVKRLGESDPEGQLKSAASSSGTDWNRDVAPFLGGDAGLYVRSLGTSTDDFQGAVIIRCQDANRALNVLEQQSGASFSGASHDGMQYLTSDDGKVLLARLGDHVVAANDQQSLFNVMDLKAGKGSALDTVADFKALRDELATNFLVFTYVSTQDLVKGLLGSDALAQTLTGNADFARPVALELGAKSGSFELQSATVKGDGKVAPMMQPHTSRFAGLLPAETSAFFSTNGIAQTWDQITPMLHRQLDDAISQTGQYGSLDDALQAAGQQIGLSSLTELINLFSGETAVAVTFPSGSDQPSFLVMAEVSDEQHASDVLAQVAASSGAAGSTTQAGKTTIRTFSDDSGNQLGYAVTDGYVAFGSLPLLTETINQPDATLAQQPGYQNTVLAVPGGLGSYLYLDLAGLLQRFAGDSLPGDLSGLQAIQGLILNAVDLNGISRFSGVVAVGR